MLKSVFVIGMDVLPPRGDGSTDLCFSRGVFSFEKAIFLFNPGRLTPYLAEELLM